MLLTSWVESMRVAFDKSRKATLNPRRRLQLRSVPSSARQKVQRRIAIEQLEDRTLLTSLIINQLTAGLGLTLDNSVLDADSDGTSDYDSIIFEDLTINASSGTGVSIDLDGLLFNEPFTILFDNVAITGNGGSGIDIELSNLLIDTIAIDSSTITGGVANAFNLDLTDVTLNEFNIVDSVLSGQAGAGVSVAVSVSTIEKTSKIEETSIRRSTIDGVSFDVTDGAILRHTTLADNTIGGTSGQDGVSLNLVDSVAEEFRLTNNDNIQGVSINVDDTVDGGAALLTELYLHSNTISGNTAGDGVRIDLNNVDQFVSITGNSITSNSGHGIVFDQVDGDLSGDISDNIIANNAGHGVYFTPDTTNPVPVDAGPGVPAFEGVPGPTNKIDLAAPRNEVQLISFAGQASGGTFTITYTDSRGVEFVTAGISYAATAAQVKAGLLAATPVLGGVEVIDIDVDDILVNGNVTDGFEIEFVNDLAGRNMSLLTVDPTNLTIPDAVINPTAVSSENISEVQHLTIDTTNPLSVPITYGYFSLSLFGETEYLSYTLLEDLTDPGNAAAAALAIQDAINQMADDAGFTDNPAMVEYNVGTGEFDITFLDTLSLRGTDVPQVTIDDSGLNYSVLVTEIRTGTSAVDEQQRLQFRYRDGNPNPLVGPFDPLRLNPFELDGAGFITNLSGTPLPNDGTNPYYVDLVFDGSGVRVYLSEDPDEFSTRLEDALNFLDRNTTDDDFNVSGDFEDGFVVTFIGAHDRENVELIESSTPLLIDLEEETETEGSGQNEVQTITFPIPAQGGTYTLDFSLNFSGPTAPIEFDATAADVQEKLESLDGIDPGDIIVTGSMASGGFAVEFTGQYRALGTGGATLSINDDLLEATVPQVVAISEGTSNNEVQEIIINGIPDSGFFSLEYNGLSTGPIAHDATAHDIWLALTDGSIPELTQDDVFVREVIYGADPTNQGLEFAGFEIEFTGRLAGTNTSQLKIVADTLLDSGSNPLTMTIKTTTVGGYLRGIRGNTISGNAGAGIEVDLAMYTSFYGDIVGNTISSNQTQGINLIAADPTTLKSVDFSLSVDSNTMDANLGAAIAVNMEDTAAGDLSVTNNTITRTVNDNLASTPYTGDAIYVDLYGTDVHFEAFNQLRDLTIDGNFIGTDSTGSFGLGNAGNGIGIHIEENTIIDRTQISNNVIMNNTGDGVNFHREDNARVGAAVVDPIVGEERAVMIYSNTVAGNSNGINILAQNGSLTTTDFEIKDNVLSSNMRDGIKLHAEADALIFADIINNQITLNSFNGIESTTRSTSYDGTDQRDVAGTWIQNDISFNAQHGIEISGKIGNHAMLFIGLDGVDPATGIDRGNLIEANGRDGIQIAAFQDPIDGRVKIANNQILSNQTGGVELSGKGLSSSIDNNLIANNTGKGIDINSNGAFYSFIRGNTITENTEDGLEVLSANFVSHSEDGNTIGRAYLGVLTSVTAVGNFIDNNGGRGVDLQTEDQADSDFRFGDGTEAGANLITSNALEGFYVVTTASAGQDQDADSTDTLDATGSVEDSHADMVLQIDTNYITQNGTNGNFSSNGLILRIGTMAGEHADFTTHDPGTDAGTGSESSLFGDGRSNVSVTNNVFEGNFGEDFYVESFTSTVDPATTVDTWVAPGSNPSFRIPGSSYQGDPLARLNLIFEGNIGNGLNVTNVGAFYNNAEPDFKSRLNNKAAPNPDGPFTSATRRRNAQRVASRTGLAPFGAPNAAPTSVGSVADAFLASPGGPIQITTTTEHGLSTGDVVEISNVATDELGDYDSRLSPANGVFVITYIDAFNFTLNSTEGAIIGDESPNSSGTWSYNNNGAFLYSGMGSSTFRIAQGFDSVGDGFLDGDGFDLERPFPGRITGELNFDWDTWVPDSDSFLAPYASTFLTADISVANTDPTNQLGVGDFIISFTENVVGVNIDDFALYRNNIDISSLLTDLMLIQDQNDPRVFRLDIDSILDDYSDGGEYELRLLNDGTIEDATYRDADRSYLFGFDIPANRLLFGDVERFTIDTVAPTADIVDVPVIRSGALGEVVVNFSEDVTGVDLSDFTLTLNGDNVSGPMGNLSSTLATLTQVTGSQFILDLSKVTSLSGDYELTLVTNNSITDLAGNALDGQTGNTAVDASTSWTNDSMAPVPSFENVNGGNPLAPGDTLTATDDTIELTFTEPLAAGHEPVLSDFELVLTTAAGNVVDSWVLDASVAMITTGDNQTYTIEITDPSIIEANGIYTLTFNGAGSVAGIEDDAGNEFAGTVSETWQRGSDISPLTVGIEPVDESGSNVTSLIINFSKLVKITGPTTTIVDFADFELTREFGTNPGVVDLSSASIVALNGTGTEASRFEITFEQSIASNNTTTSGIYTFTVKGDATIEDLGGNTLANEASVTWRTDVSAPEATIEGLPDLLMTNTLLTNAGIVTINFSEAVTGVDINDFRLTLNGQDISLNGLIVNGAASSYTLDLSSVTQPDGNYTLTLVAAGAGIESVSDGQPMLDNASQSWTKASTIDLSAGSLDDGADATVGDGIVGTNGDPDSQTLRAAIQEANALAGENVIILSAGTYILDIAGGDEDLAATGDLDIRDNLIIRGQGVDETIIDVNEANGFLDRIFQVFAGITLTLEDLTITGGRLTGSDDGAGIRNSGTTTLRNVKVEGNESEDSAGGINNTGTMYIIDSTITGNTAASSGGGIRNTGILEISGSTLSGNSTDRDGGALFNAGAGVVTVTNTTWSGNTATRSGGAIRNTATLNATNNTMTLNSAGTSGGAIANSGTASLQNNLVLGNTAAVDVELTGDYNSQGGNLIGLVGSATGFGANDILGVADPDLVLDSNLADNGGPTQTHALLLGSVAIDAGINFNIPSTEQRGSQRVLGSNVDIGAVEYGAFFVNSLEDTEDETPGDGIVADANGNVTLRAAIQEANALGGDALIILGAGTYDLSLLGADEDDADTGDLDITNTTGTLTIVGAGSDLTIINAAGLGDDRVFDVLAGAELTLDGLMVTGGNIVGGSGGGIRNFGTVSLVNATVDGNTAEFYGGGILNGDPGQAGVLNLSNSVVSNNSSVDGGGIYNDGQSELTIVNSTLAGNTASEDGAGLYNNSQVEVTINLSSITGNTATLNGGGIYNNHLSTLNITDSKVNGNTAHEGGGLFNADSATLEATRTTVSGNTSILSGAGIYNDGGLATLDDVSILINHANQDGGGLYNATGGEITITDSFFDNNTADRDGGAIANFGTTLSIIGTTLRDSVAERFGGGLYNDQEEGSVSLLSSTIYNNEAESGGGIYNQELGVITLDLSDVLQNIAVSDGGGIYNTSNATLTVSRTTVDSNQAVNGAGIYNDDVAQLNLTDSTVSNNVATGDGGGLYNNTIVLANIVNTTISGNAALGDGGGIFNSSDGSLEIVNATIYNNDADQGGGIYNDTDGFVRLANTIVAGNRVSGSTSPDLYGDFVSRGYNLIGLIDTALVNGFADGVNNDQVGTTSTALISAGLGALQDNGGVTFTHELLSGSLARDRGNNFYAPTDDQRGFARLFDGDGNGSLIVDIGAFESGYIVTSFGDSVDANPGDGVSVDANGASTLRAAIIESNARAGADTILLGVGTYTLSLFGLAENNSYLGDLDITDDLTIIGAGSGKTFIDANYLDRIFQIFSGVNVSIRGVTLINGDVTAVEDGGAILNFGNLKLEDVDIENSEANRGGALFNNGVVTMTSSEFTLNTAIADGGAIFNGDSGTITVSLSTINDNNAENGGGLFNSLAGTVSIVDTTLDGNVATVTGGAIYNSSDFSIGNGEGGSVINIPAATGGNGEETPDYDYNYPDYESGYVEDAIPNYENDDSVAAIQSEVPPLPVEDTFNLSSLPGASHTIYLDFTGHTTTGTQWNSSFGTIVTPAYDTDGDVSTFSLAEIEVIQRTWLRVVEDFAPFNVNVTTVEPPVSDLMRTSGSDTRWGIRVVIGENTWYNDAGGVAFVGSFSDSLDTPTYVFNSSLIGVSEAVSHEVGHTLGLIHDGTSSLEYYPGHGTGTTGWAPIMGVGYNQNLVQWSSGEYTDANNLEDDLSIITSQNGFTYRLDDHGSSIGAASNIVGGMASGIVERNTDLDFFQFVTTGGDVTIDPFFESPNLDILATLYDESGAQIQTSNPLGALNASFIGLAAGTYYVSIEGTGEGSVTGTGYSDYGSLGQYTITVEGQPPMLEAGALSISNSTISNNIAGTRGGGLLNEDKAIISNVTFSGNEAGKEGGAIHNTGELTINNTTIYDNFTEGSGGGIYSVADTASVSIKNTILAGNNALVGGSDAEGVFTSEGNNLVGTRGGTVGFVDGFNSDIVGTDAQRIDPALSILQDNGGPTQTHALLAGSLAIDAGDNTDGDATDQRGATRPTDTTSDIGAFEIVTPTIIIDDVAQVETDSGETVFEIVVSLSNTNVDEVTVDYFTSNGTADAGIDYAFTTGTVTFSPGESTQVIEVVVYGDTEVEDHETFYVNLLNASGAQIGVESRAEVTILNEEASILISDVEMEEGADGATTSFNFTVSLATQVNDIVTVDLQTIDWTGMDPATAGVDYEALGLQTITFNPGDDLDQTITVTVYGDSEIEKDERFQVQLLNASANASIDKEFGVGTIKNDDFAYLSVSDVTFAEKDDTTGPTTKFVFTVSLSQIANDDVVVYLSTDDDSAVSGLDYIALVNHDITFVQGETEKEVVVEVYKDTIPEGTETFLLQIVTVSGDAEVADDTGMGTILENAIVVNTFDDVVDSTDDFKSLREAITEANDNPGEDTIILMRSYPNVPMNYKITQIGANEDQNMTGDFDILGDLNIIGQGSELTVIDAMGLDRIFHVGAGAKVTIDGLTLMNGDADNAGAILAHDELTLSDMVFENNTSDFLGGAIASESTLNISDSVFRNNQSGTGGGGAIYQYDETLTVTRTTFTGNSTVDGRAGAVFVDTAANFIVSQSLFVENSAGSRGGAIYNLGTTTADNTTFSANHAGSLGGAIFNLGTLDLLNNTIAFNTADNSGSGIANQHIAKLVNTIVALNGALGTDDLTGDYNEDNQSFNNLIGSIGAATGFVHGEESNIVGTLGAPIDPKLGELFDNGGPTLTHALLSGSQAIDAGRNDSISPGDVDQRGYSRLEDGDGDTTDTVDIGAFELETQPPPTGGAPLFGTEGDSEEIGEDTSIQITVVKDRTSVSSDGHAFVLPQNEEWINEWDSFWVEVWVDTASGFGISDVLTNLAYNTAYFTATSFEFGSNFNTGRTIIIDDEAGLIRNLGASTHALNVGGSGHALLARIKFESLAGDGVDVDSDDLVVEPLQLGLEILNTDISVGGVGEVEFNVGDLPETDLYPVIYDVNNDGSISYRDLTYFAAVYNQEVYSSSAEFTAIMDFDKSGKVDYQDLVLLASNYGKSRGGNSSVYFPENFGQTWIGDSLEVVSGDDTIEEVIEAAVDTWETALGLDEPLDVQVIVYDFGTAQLGSGQGTDYDADGIPVGGRVAIDDDANGLGWHVDVTDLPTGGGYDLYTVLLHEIGHVLGFTRYYSGFGSHVETNGSGDLVFVGSDFTVTLDSTGLHMEDPAYPDDLMNDTLDPGVRKTVSDINVKMLLESYAAVSGTPSGGGASPIMATSGDQTIAAEPVLIQSPEAAKKFVSESTVGFVAPAAIKAKEEEADLSEIQTSSTFHVIQPLDFGQEVADEMELDETVFEDLYSSREFGEGEVGSDADELDLVFAHADDEFDLAGDLETDQGLMDDAFSNWEGPLL